MEKKSNIRAPASRAKKRKNSSMAVSKVSNYETLVPM